MTELLNQLMSNGGDCRTAPATPGLLNNIIYNIRFCIKYVFSGSYPLILREFP